MTGPRASRMPCSCGPSSVCYPHRTINRKPIAVTDQHPARLQDAPSGSATYTHRDGRACWHDVTRPAGERWRNDTRPCIRAHAAMIEDETDLPADDADTELADLAGALAPHLRDRLRTLLADVTP